MARKKVEVLTPENIKKWFPDRTREPSTHAPELEPAKQSATTSEYNPLEEILGNLERKRDATQVKENAVAVPLIHRKSEIVALAKSYLLHPFSSLSSEKVRFIHYPQLYLLPTVPLAMFLPAIPEPIAVLYSAAYGTAVLSSIIESRIYKKNAIDLAGNLEAMLIRNPKKKELLNGRVIEEREKVIELHWVPGKRDKTENSRLLVLKTSQSFIESLLDLREKLIKNDSRFDGINAIRMTSALISDSMSLFSGETNPITNNRFLRLLDHMGTRVNLLMNLNFKAALLQPVKTSQTAWVTREKIVGDDTKNYLEDKLRRIKRLINNAEKNKEL